VVFNWLLNGKSVSEYQDINVGSFGKKMSVLSIDSISRNHVGNYTCVVTNPARMTSFTTQLTVKGTNNCLI